jgi:hypothetical protein
MIDLDSIQKRLARVWGKWPTAGVAAPNADEQGPKAWAAHGPPRFHATPQGRARQWVQAQADAEFLKHAPSDIAALVAEVERLRDEAELLRTGRDVTRSYTERVEAEGLALRGEVERVRAAVATYLRGLADDYGVCIDLSLAEQADIIERGEYRREGGE